jgi:nucleoside-diphosphate-sugar epimerase
MIIGNGLIAGIFAPAYREHREVIIFASGVSNSGGNSASAFEREEALLRKVREDRPESRLVYFSTVSILDPSLAGSAYVHHKIRMEALLRSSEGPSLICRTSNIVGHSRNPNTLLNHLVDRITRGETIDLWEGAMRNLLDIDDLYTAMDRCLNRKDLSVTETVNIFNPQSYGIRAILSAIEEHFGQRAIVRPVAHGEWYEIPGKERLPELFGEALAHFGPGYLPRLLDKYYPLPQGTKGPDNPEIPLP